MTALLLPDGPFTAAAIQMCSLPDINRNLDAAGGLAESAARAGANLISLPEAFVYMGPEAELATMKPQVAAAGLDFLRETATRLGVILCGGVYEPAPDGRLYNTCVAFGPDGVELGRYRKIHLFDVAIPDGMQYSESRNVAPGDAIGLFETERCGRIGMSVCYDLRFPELYRKLAAAGAGVLLVPSAFTEYTGRVHWRLLLQARAVENTCYVIAAAQTGNHYGQRRSYGHAMIIDPWGEILADAGDQPGFALAEIDPARIQQIRREMPSLENRRLI